MPFVPLVLPTDVLLWLLPLLLWLVWRRSSWLRWRLKPLWRRPSGFAAGVVLASLAVVALLDSVHFRPYLPAAAGAAKVLSPQSLSLLDVWVLPWAQNKEKTYSAPLATRSWAREASAEGRVYPRLRHGGAHLLDESDKAADIAWRLLAALALGLAVAGATWLWLRRYLRRVTEPSFPPHTAVLMAGLIASVIGLLLWLAPYYHVLGTTKVGQDVLYLCLKSLRTAWIMGGITTVLMLPLALLLGLAAGYFGGLVDDLVQYLYTVLNAVPAVLLISASVLVLQVFLEQNSQWFSDLSWRADARLLMLCVALGLASWTGLCRLMRAEALRLRQLDYISAARSFGASHWHIVSGHLLPQVLPLVVMAVVMDFSSLVLAESVLSYLSVGVDPSTPSFGSLINDARLELAREPVVWWALAGAFGFMLVLVLAANVLSDRLREALDPRFVSR